MERMDGIVRPAYRVLAYMYLHCPISPLCGAAVPDRPGRAGRRAGSTTASASAARSASACRASSAMAPGAMLRSNRVNGGTLSRLPALSSLVQPRAVSHPVCLRIATVVSNGTASRRTSSVPPRHPKIRMRNLPVLTGGGPYRYIDRAGGRTLRPTATALPRTARVSLV